MIKREKSVAIFFYDISVPTFLQTVRAVGGFLDRAVAHCAETYADLDDVVKARLFPEMAPFHFQIEALVHHAVWGLEAVKTGVLTRFTFSVVQRGRNAQPWQALRLR
jgi:uncharacterized protein